MVFHRGNSQRQQPTAVRAQFVKIIWEKNKKNQTHQHNCFILYLCGHRTSSLDRTGVDLTVVPPAGPHRAAALLLGGVPGQDVIAEINVV